MSTFEQWSFLFMIFILFAQGNAIPLGDSNSEESGVKEYQSIFQLILSNDVYTTSRSLGSESDDYEQKETSTVASKAVSKEKRSLESEDDIYDNEQKEQTTVALKAANVNRSLEKESDDNYYEQENSTVAPTPTAVSTGYNALEKKIDGYSHEYEQNTLVPTVLSTDGSLRAKSESQEKQGQKRDSVEKEKVTAEPVQGRRNDYDDHKIYVSTYAWTHQTFPATRKKEVTQAWSALMVDDYFLPYMGASLSSLSGDWVYYQKTVVKGWDWPVAGSTLFYFPEKRTDAPPDTFQRYCTKLYQRMGPVCGYRMNQGSWTYNYRNFKDWCELEYMNSLNYFDRFAWSILNRGECPYYSPFFPEMWSSQDGFWNLQSMNILQAKAQQADEDVEYVMHE